MPDHYILIHLANSRYDKAWVRNDDGEIVQALADVPDAKRAASDNLVNAIQSFLPSDQSLVTTLSLSDVESRRDLTKEMTQVKNRIRDNPTKKFLLMYVVAG